MEQNPNATKADLEMAKKVLESVAMPIMGKIYGQGNGMPQDFSGMGQDFGGGMPQGYGGPTVDDFDID
jgi:hypothetical protein